MYPKTPAFSTAEIGKNIKHMWWHKAIPKTKTFLCFVSFVLFFFYLLETLFFLFLLLHPKTPSSMRHCKEAPIGSSGLCHKCDLAQRHSTLAIALWDAAGHCDVRSSQAGRGPNRKRGGSMTGTLASRCRLGDNAALINFLFSCHNDRRR